MRKVLLLVLALFFQPFVYAETFESTAAQVTLVEVFSSERCGSCPAAADWVRNMGSQSALWKKFVPVIMHVDYWDESGWKDVFVAPAFTERQSLYSRVWGNTTPYTPCVVMNGFAWQGWVNLITPPTIQASPGVLKAETQGTGRFKIIFTPASKEFVSYQAHLALLGFGIKSDVQRGENSGKSLRHDFIVLDYQRNNMGGSATLTAAMNLNVHDSRTKKFAVAVWVTRSDNPLPIQATGGYLN